MTPAFSQIKKDWTEASRDIFDDTDDLNSMYEPWDQNTPSYNEALGIVPEDSADDPDASLYTFWPDPEGKEIGLNAQVLCEAQLQSPAIRRQSHDRQTQQLAESMWNGSGIIVIPRQKRLYMVCDLNEHRDYNVKISVQDCRRFAVCSCGASELCPHVKRVLPLHLALAKARLELGAEAESFLCNLLCRVASLAMQHKYSFIANNAIYYQHESARRYRALKSREAFAVTATFRNS